MQFGGLLFHVAVWPVLQLQLHFELKDFLAFTICTLKDEFEGVTASDVAQQVAIVDECLFVLDLFLFVAFFADVSHVLLDV